ncbi:MAG: hypothetical protein H6679_00970 [Epsilonproteobacteria bacterium]|nr:hypothetical protein [Campylobacterota bacterium]
MKTNKLLSRAFLIVAFILSANIGQTTATLPTYRWILHEDDQMTLNVIFEKGFNSTLVALSSDCIAPIKDIQASASRKYLLIITDVELIFWDLEEVYTTKENKPNALTLTPEHKRCYFRISFFNQKQEWKIELAKNRDDLRVEKGKFTASYNIPQIITLKKLSLPGI